MMNCLAEANSFYQTLIMEMSNLTTVITNATVIEFASVRITTTVAIAAIIAWAYSQATTTFTNNWGVTRAPLAGSS